MAVGTEVWKESEGRSVNVSLTATVVAKQVAVVEAWLGLTAEAGDSGDNIALLIDQQEYQFEVPTGLTVAKGDIVYIEVADLTGHTPDDTAYSTSSGAGKEALFKATAAKDDNDVVTGILWLGKDV
jgi:plastocyanin